MYVPNKIALMCNIFHNIFWLIDFKSNIRYDLKYLYVKKNMIY